MNLVLNKNNALFFFAALTAAVSAVFYLSDDVLIRCIIVLGHAHFLIAYIYANKYNKIDKRYLYKFLILFLVFGAFSYFVFIESSADLFDLFLFSTLLLFSFHYFNDEYKISGIKEIENRKIGVLSVLFSFLALLLVTVFKVSSPVIYLITAVSLVLSLVFLRGFFKNKSFSLGDFLYFSFFLLNIVLPLYGTYFGSVGVYTIAGLIILFHYTRWYLRYFDIFSGQKLKEYLSFVFLCNLFFALLFAWYYLAPSTGILFMLFAPAFFFGWTLTHIIMSIRKEDALF